LIGFRFYQLIKGASAYKTASFRRSIDQMLFDLVDVSPLLQRLQFHQVVIVHFGPVTLLTTSLYCST
jgi:hypothetical protein